MHGSRRILALALLGAGLSPVVATADEASEQDVQEQMMIMQQRMRRMEDQLAEAQRRAPPPGAEPQKDCFFCSIEFEGWVAASYMWNFRGFEPGIEGRDLGGVNSGTAFYPFHPDHNSFQVDQVWMGMERPVSEEERAGFRLDFLIGKTGDILNGGNDGFSGSFQDFHVFQAYVQYLAPLGSGVTFKLGKFATLTGAEVVQAPANFNITRGNVWNLFQPISHTGILATITPWEDGTASLGVMNETRSFTAADIDLNNNKAITWQLGHQLSEAVFASFNGAWGAADSGAGFDTPAGEKEVILDWVLTYKPTEKFSSYVNADFLRNDGGDGTDGYGIAAAGRYALTERMGVAARAEWVDLDVAGDDLQVVGLTGTVDYMLTGNLQLRGELRWDQATGSPDEHFFTSRDSIRGVPGSGLRLTKDDQIVAGVEVIYSF